MLGIEQRDRGVLFMITKDNTINPAGMSPELLFGLLVCEQIYDDWGYSLVITSLNDSKHMSGSLHYSGNAADIRTRDLKDPAKSLIPKKIKETLHPDYDIVVEPTHLHIEYQPKGPRS